jgi:hypothetical protein
MSRLDKLSIVRKTVVSARIGNDLWKITNDGTVDENIPHDVELDGDPNGGIQQLNNGDLQDILDRINAAVHNEAVSLHRNYETRVNQSTGVTFLLRLAISMRLFTTRPCHLTVVTKQEETINRRKVTFLL